MSSTAHHRTDGIPIEHPGLPELDFAVADAESDVESAKARLADQARYIAEKMGRLVDHLDRGLTINSLGELQGQGSELDRLCGELHVKEASLQRLRWLDETLNVPVHKAAS